MKTINKVLFGSVLLLLALFVAACNQTTGKASGVGGLVTVTTNPSGVVVVLTPKNEGNVISLGETPIINRVVPAGRYVLSLSKEGYESFAVGVEVKGATPIEISYRLNKLPVK